MTMLLNSKSNVDSNVDYMNEFKHKAKSSELSSVTFESQNNSYCIWLSQSIEYYNRINTCDTRLFMQNVHKAVEHGGCLYRTREGNKIPEILIYHQYLFGIDWNNDDFLINFKAYLITHDLSRSKMILWVEEPDFATMSNSSVDSFIKQHQNNLELRIFDYSVEVKTTPFISHPLFQSNEAIHKMPPSHYSDIVRNIVTFNYGGVWVDNDFWFLRDMYDLVYGVGYPFLPAFSYSNVNIHVLFQYKHANLGQRIMSSALLFPFEYDVVYPNHEIYGIYNDALYSYVFKYQQLLGSIYGWTPENYITAYPMFLMDPLWSACLPQELNSNTYSIFKNGELGKAVFNLITGCPGNMNLGAVFGVHSRYPKYKYMMEKDCFVSKYIEEVNKYFPTTMASTYSRNPSLLFKEC